MVIFLGPHHEGVAALAGTAVMLPNSIAAAAAAENAAASLRRRIIFVSSI
jgi:hypothetical protein